MACGIQIRFMGVSPHASSRTLTDDTVYSPIGQARGHAVSVNIDQLKTSALAAPSQMQERVATTSIGRKEGGLETDDGAVLIRRHFEVAPSRQSAIAFRTPLRGGVLRIGAPDTLIRGWHRVGCQPVPLGTRASQGQPSN